jgi:hypothetical protein
MELEETIRSTLGEGKATEAMIKLYAKQEWFLPKTLADANIQLTTCQRFLEKLTCRESIAVQGYARGEELLEKYSQIFESHPSRQPVLGQVSAPIGHNFPIIPQGICEVYEGGSACEKS